MKRETKKSVPRNGVGCGNPNKGKKADCMSLSCYKETPRNTILYLAEKVPLGLAEGRAHGVLTDGTPILLKAAAISTTF